MKCPLIVAGYWSSSPGFNTSKTECLKEECAWWYPPLELCSVAILAVETRLISESMTLLLAREGGKP